MPLKVHRALRADQLVAGLADILVTPLADPFATELVIVPAKGIERWLSQHLSHRLGVGSSGDGVCAGVEFRSPASLVAEVVGRSDDDPWAPAAMVWPLLGVIDAHAAEPWCAPLARHLGYIGDDEDDLRKGRRYSVARRIAGLFASYALQRPQLLESWQSGTATDGAGQPLPDDLAWQPPLWRLLLEAIDEMSPVERHRTTLARLETDPDSVDLPPRLSLFGHTRIAATERELLHALARHRDVHLWLPHPSPALWEALETHPIAARRDLDDSHRLVHQPVLRSLGRDLRELQLTLGADDAADVADAPAAPGLLGRLQHDIATNRPGEVLPREPDDASVQVHACHGQARQVDVLREVLLGLLTDDPNLEPRDILVMCPDIETYAPLLTAAFGMSNVTFDEGAASAPHPGHALRVMLADRAPAQTNELLGVLTQVLDVAGGRAEASRILDLMSTGPVRRRFGFSDDDLEQITTWVQSSGVKWAFDAEHRSLFGLQGLIQNTWRWGIDRVLAGVAVSDDAGQWFDTTLPLDNVSSTSIELAGRLAEFIDRLQTCSDRMQGSQSVHTWLRTLTDTADALTAVAAGEEWQIGQLHRELAAMAAGDEDAPLQLRLPDIRALMAERLGGRPSRANFRNGTLTVCTMTPMRSVPHKVVCLIGLDDGSFPRTGSVDGDDVLLRQPLVGERDPRNEDRQLMLDAIMSATQHLVLTYTGANETTNQVKPPSVPLQDLIECLRRMVPSEQAGDIVTQHPLQPFAPVNFTDDLAQPSFSFDARAYDAAQVASRERTSPPAIKDLSAPTTPGEVSVAELVTFFKSPAKAFLKQRLEIALPEDATSIDDAIPIEFGSLDEWAVGNRALAGILAGDSPDTVRNRLWREGILPPGQLGWQKLTQIIEDAFPIATKVQQLRGGTESRAVDIDLTLGSSRRLVGTLGSLHGDHRILPIYSKQGQRYWLDAWIPHLALAASRPGRPLVTDCVGRPGFNVPAHVRWTSFTDPDEPARILDELVQIRDLGMTQPLALPMAVAHQWVEYRDQDRQFEKARWAWLGSRFAGPVADVENVLIWGPDLNLRDLLAFNPDFDQQARAVWLPLLERMERVRR